MKIWKKIRYFLDCIRPAGVLANYPSLEWTKLASKTWYMKGDSYIRSNAESFASPLFDNELREKYPQLADRLAPWRNLADMLEYNGPVAWLVKQGFTLKEHAAKAGPCCNDLLYLQYCHDFEDNPTEDCLVFWVPRLLDYGTNKNVRQMEDIRAELKDEFGLPENHAISFGSIQLLFALILANFAHTGERSPKLYAVSDTFCSRQDKHLRFVAGSFLISLFCNTWQDNGPGDWSVSFFMVGIEKL